MIVPLFLIVSSSVYPTYTYGIQNNQLTIIADALAQREDKDNRVLDVDTSGRHSSSASADEHNAHPKSLFDISHQPSNFTTPAALATLSIDSVYTVWNEESPPGNTQVFFKRGTIAFDPNIDLSNSTRRSSGPDVAASGNNVYVVWIEDTPGHRAIVYKRSTDGGATFERVVKLSTNPGFNIFEPAVAVSGNNVYVVWSEEVIENPVNSEVMYRRSTDGGVTFGSAINLSSDAGRSTSGAIVASGNNVYVVWPDNSLGNFEIFYRRSTDGGATFGSTSDLSNTIEESEFPRIAASGNNVFLVWDDDIAGITKPLYKRSTDGGASFSSTIKIGNSGGTIDIPNIAASGSNVYVVWPDSTDNPTGEPEIFYRRSTDSGATFGNAINLSNFAGVSQLPDIAASRNNVYVVWTELGHLSYRRSTDGGSTFESTIILSSTAGTFILPKVAAVNNINITQSLVNR